MKGENESKLESVRKAQLRDRMICQTEDYIEKHLEDREVPWPRRYEPMDQEWNTTLCNGKP